jgi:hypothetical protein
MVGVFFTKLADEILATVRSVFMIRDQHFLSALFNMIKTFFGLLTIHMMIMNPGVLTVLVASVAVFIGTYFPAKMMQRRQVVAV